MTSAAEVGIAPRVWYTNIQDRIAITDYVDARPLPLEDAVVRLATTLRPLHALPRFPLPRTGNYFDTMDSFVERFQAAKILPESETEELFERYRLLLRVYPRDYADMVSSHNDLKPENMLFDGERVWLVDWEAAFLNDRYHDLAVVANFVVTNEATEEQLLEAYFGEPAGEYRLARFYLMRQLLHHFYTVMFLLIGSSGQPIERKLEAPAFRAFHDDMWAGRIDLAGNEMKLQYGIVHMNEALRNMRGARLQHALQIVAGRHAAA
jgi:Phosphotransferase enzyme family